MQFATGAMGSLLPKLGKLLLEEYNLKGSVKKGIGDLKAELESMQAALVKVSSVPLDQLDPHVKIWANEVRELSYAIEDSLDSFMTRVEGVEPTKTKIKHLLKKARNKFTKFKARHEIANDIEDIESQVRKIKERYDRYKIDDVVANLATTIVDPRLTALYSKVSDLVGTDEPIHELMKILSEDAEGSQQNIKIVSIVGFGGLGKTTLAKALYDKVSKTYEYQGFVPVGQNQGVKKVLSDILFELDKELHKAAERLDERQLINRLQEVLAGKRYFLVIDDLWDIHTWEIIKCAFVDGHPESKIIITTRIFDVARRADSIYHMKPLSDYNSKFLFYTRTCGGDEEATCDNQPDEVTNKILQKCGGVPLAIITIASLLVGKPSADWSKVYDAIGFGDEGSEVIKNTRKILSFSYYDLRPYLKTCLLYLGMYPEDILVDKRELIWRWVSEGFVPHKQGIGSYELGESYYNDLVNKSLIQEATSSGNIKSCYVHDMVLDLIRTMSMEVNFVTVQDTGENQITSSPSGQGNRVHRLAFHGEKVKWDGNIKMEHVRSFVAITCSNSGMPPLWIFKVLRVLVIDDCVLSEDFSIKYLGKLVQLRYLGLLDVSVKLPEDIGHDLKFLEVLDVRGGLRRISELPQSVSELQNLRCLRGSPGTTMKGEIGKLTCLEELELHSVEKVPNFFRDVGKLTKLRVLDISLGRSEESACKVLVESLLNLHKIQSLAIRKNFSVEIIRHNEIEPQVRVGSLEELTPSSRLRFIFLQNILITKIPSWINALSVPLLSELVLNVEVLEAQDLKTLGRLPSLIKLDVCSVEKSCVSYTFGSDEFQKLIWLSLHVHITLGEGALPMLETLDYSASAGRKDSLVPWNNSCPSLYYVTCRLDCRNSGHTEVKAAKAALREAGRAKHLRVDIKLENYKRNAARLIDARTSSIILPGLERTNWEDITADQLRRMITSLQTLLRSHSAGPRLGRYREQDMRDFVAKLKNMLRDHDEEANNSDDDTDETDGDYACWYTKTHSSDDDDDSDYTCRYIEADHSDDDEDTKQEEVENHVATTTSSGTRDQGVAIKPSIA